MFSILQRYIAWELTKTFVLVAIGLTLTFTLCGGVLNMIRAEVLTAVQLARILGFVLPISMTLTLPISALFACAIVYGRLAADNEFDACRASGINIHRLLAPALGLSLFAAAFTYTFTNHLIPSFVEKLDDLVRKDIQRIVYAALSNRGYLKFQDYVLYARETQLHEEDPEMKTILIRQAAFLELEQESLAYCGTADRAEVDFTRDPVDGGPVVRAALYGIRSLDLARLRFMEFERQPFDPMQLPRKIRIETKFMTLPDLLTYHRAPLSLPSIQDDLGKLDRLIREAQFYRWAYERLTTGDRVLRLADDHVSYELRAELVGSDADSLRPTLNKVTVKEKSADGRQRVYKAENCRLSVSTRAGLGTAGTAAMLSLRGNVSMTDTSLPSAPSIVRTKWELDKVILPADLPGMPPPVERGVLIGDLSDPRMVHEAPPPLNLGTRVEDARVGARKSIVKSALQISGLIHSRLAFSASTLVILVLAAALGIIFRGGQLLTAFVISFLPGMLVVVMNIMGRQLTENTGTHFVGIAVIWLGIALLLVADVVVLARFLKR